MNCPGCGNFLFMKDPTKCPHCGAAVKICEPCFGTGEIKAIGSVAVEHRQRIVIQCTACGGKGLVPSDAPVS